MKNNLSECSISDLLYEVDVAFKQAEFYLDALKDRLKQLDKAMKSKEEKK